MVGSAHLGQGAAAPVLLFPGGHEPLFEIAPALPDTPAGDGPGRQTERVMVVACDGCESDGSGEQTERVVVAACGGRESDGREAVCGYTGNTGEGAGGERNRGMGRGVETERVPCRTVRLRKYYRQKAQVYGCGTWGGEEVITARARRLAELALQRRP